jgi:hypothetical protein
MNIYISGPQSNREKQEQREKSKMKNNAGLPDWQNAMLATLQGKRIHNGH